MRIHTMKSDLYRLGRNMALYVSPIIAALLIGQEAFGIGLIELFQGEAKNHCVEFFNMTVYFSPLSLLTPFLAAIPYSASFCEDVNSGFFTFALYRSFSIKQYIKSKFLCDWFSGFLVIFVPLLAFGIICIFFAAPYTEEYILENGNQLQNTAWNVLGTTFGGGAVIFSQIFFFSCFSASCAVIALTASAFLPNPFFTWCLPVILAYGGNFIFTKVHLGALNLYFSFDPVYKMLHFSSDLSGIIYMFLYHTVLFIVCYILFYFGVERRVSGGKLRICVNANKKVEA